MGFITAGDLDAIAGAMGNNGYASYLKDVLGERV